MVNLIKQNSYVLAFPIIMLLAIVFMLKGPKIFRELLDRIDYIWGIYAGIVLIVVFAMLLM